ncbi:MAG: ABC transporter ATP-binding protein [Halanaerobiales bacterium]|nr:ABC transporter ATP-binding protein [Halanaerobiales bacterium]
MENKVILEIHNLTKIFSKKKVVDDLNLTIYEGDIYGFLGPNGAGKTTTIRMILNLIYPSSGMIHLDGYNVQTNFLQAISRVGALVEIPKFYLSLTAYQNLKIMANLIPGIGKERIEEVLDIVGILERAGDKVKTYSLGMKQRLGIAGALLGNPKLVILDEPTNGLDPQGMIEIRKTIKQLAHEQKITFFISTHLLHEVEQICNRVAILHKGKLLAHGRVKDLLYTDNEVIEVYTKNPQKVKECARKLNFVKSIKKASTGLYIQIAKGYSKNLLNKLVSETGEIEYFVPRNQSLEKFFIDLTKEGEEIA